MRILTEKKLCEMLAEEYSRAINDYVKNVQHKTDMERLDKLEENIRDMRQTVDQMILSLSSRKKGAE